LEKLDSVQKQFPLTSEGDELLPSTTRTKVLPHLIEGRAEALCRTESPKAECRVVALFDAAMILLDPAIEISIVAMFVSFRWACVTSNNLSC
jgi:hypothetical protein